MVQQKIGDNNPEVTYAAVGRALSAWESVEQAMSGLFTVFEGKPGDFDAYRRYGDSGTTLLQRTSRLREASARYAIQHPCQDREGDLLDIINRVSALAISRHQLAHGIVEEIEHCGPDAGGSWVPPARQFHLNATWAFERSLGTPWPGYGSAVILSFASQFDALAEAIRDLTDALLQQ